MKTFAAMNTEFLLDGLSEADTATAETMILHGERTFSRFREDSEVSVINRNKGRWTRVSELTFRLLEDAWRAYVVTGGIFNPFLGADLRRAGYDGSFETLSQTMPTRRKEEKDKDCSATPLGCPADQPVLLFDAAAGAVLLAETAELDLGGFAKGWIAQYAAERLLWGGAKAGLIDAGGDIILWGREPRQGVWGVEVSHPLNREDSIADLWLEGMTAMATSNVIKRSWCNPSGRRAHHILDPRTRRPVESDILQATVLTRDLAAAEQYAKSLIILGSAEGIPWLAGQNHAAAYIAVRQDGTILTSDNLSWYCQEWKVYHHAS